MMCLCFHRKRLVKYFKQIICIVELIFQTFSCNYSHKYAVYSILEFHMFSHCVCGFPLDYPISSNCPKTCRYVHWLSSTGPSRE